MELRYQISGLITFRYQSIHFNPPWKFLPHPVLTTPPWFSKTCQPHRYFHYWKMAQPHPESRGGVRTMSTSFLLIHDFLYALLYDSRGYVSTWGEIWRALFLILSTSTQWGFCYVLITPLGEILVQLSQIAEFCSW